MVLDYFKNKKNQLDKMYNDYINEILNYKQNKKLNYDKQKIFDKYCYGLKAVDYTHLFYTFAVNYKIDNIQFDNHISHLGEYNSKYNRITINNNLKDEMTISSLVHECVHKYFSDKKVIMLLKYEDCIAESVSYLILKDMGLDVKNFSLNYISTQLNSPEIFFKDKQMKKYILQEYTKASKTISKQKNVLADKIIKNNKEIKEKITIYKNSRQLKKEAYQQKFEYQEQQKMKNYCKLSRY